ncbi:MAG: TIGR02147 family protein [Fibrobacter sp.]|uniref:TIGR02147 family protein n=1 Tax=Fibrobacter sp. TaxID=35828 RepID=UPI0025B857C6|nr:TIGR02147 family protein [Fibrobacter sp.]MBR4785591.1 TIGR02147 family protein [Fibrobacter sp.]
MKPIVEYQDYHLLVKDYYEERKRTSYFSWREFAKVAGFSSSTYLRLVSEGKSNLSRVTMDRMVNAMGLSGYEVDYFKAMVNYCNAKDEERKAPYLRQMQTIALEYKVRVVDKEAVEYFDGWKHPVIRELAPLMRGATPGKMAKMCCNEISAAEVSSSLEFLTKAGFLKKDADGAYRQTEKNVTASKEGMAYAVHAMQRKMMEFAADSIDRFGPQERNVSGVTFTVNRECYERISNEIDAFRKKIIAIASEAEDADQIYRLNMQLFPMTWNLNDSREDGNEKESV